MTKLRSRAGASLILALLFFLLCIMVGASVLAAASSNAGKAAKRRREQQEYFTASSALQLVCDRLEKMEYKPNASVSENVKVVTVKVEPIPSEPSTHYTYTYTYKKITYEQKPGTVTFDADTTVNANWNAIFPVLKKELDYLFAEKFTKEECNDYHGEGLFQDDDIHAHSTCGGTDVSIPAEHILNTKVDNSVGTVLPDDALEELTKDVEIKVSLGQPGALEDEKYWLFLEARLVGGKGKVVMKAELKPTGSIPHISDPSTYNGPYPSLSDNDRVAMRWELVRIYREL